MGKLSQQAQELLNFLQNEVSLKWKHYVTLFYEVLTETSLLAVTKYDFKRVANNLQTESGVLGDSTLTLEVPNDIGIVETQRLLITSRQDKYGLGLSVIQGKNTGLNEFMNNSFIVRLICTTKGNVLISFLCNRTRGIKNLH